MNVFVLCTGRCGSVTLSKACTHATNFSSGHESRCNEMGPNRVRYPCQHIEVDNRLAFFLGRLQDAYGDNASYVHLVRDRDATAASFNRRWHRHASIMRAYADQICMSPVRDPLAVCLDYVDTTNANIRAFLRDKTRTMNFRMEDHATAFPEFWEWIGAEGDFGKAQAEWCTSHNAS